MTDTELQHLLTAADPLPADRARGLELTEAHAELLAGLMAEPQFQRTPAPPEHQRRRRLFARAGMAIAATAILLVALLSLRDDSGDSGSGTAWAAEQIRFAEASPLVLLGAPGWRVDYADEESRQDGELRFHRGPNASSRDITDAAELSWRSGGIRTWYADRAASASLTTTAPVLGTTARVYQYDGGQRGHRDITALFRYDARVLEFRAGAADLDAFKALLATLKRVDTDTWLSAMPPSVVKTPDRDSTIRQMLRGVPLPPGFEQEDIKGSELTKDRYQLGAAVAGTVACQWIKRWAEARSENDRAKEREAIAAMATARGWPVLHEMEKQGGYPEVLYAFAAAMPKGEWYGRPLTGDVNSGLGCDGLGVKLP